MKILRKDLQNRNYSGILEVQDKHNSLNKKLASNINKKLDILDKIWLLIFPSYLYHSFIESSKLIEICEVIL